jgi:peptidoglycan/xylan/chitin deacetylase (PgdA/CDA1 family)
VLSFKRVNIIFAMLLLLFSFLTIKGIVSFWFIALLFLGWITLTIIGSFHIRWNYFLPAKHFNYQVKEKSISLTFDDGPNAKFTPKVLDLLKKHHAKATFFCIGKHIEQHPKLIKRILNEGHIIGNHSYAHTNNYGFLNTNQVIEDISKTQQLIKNTLNIENTLFRPPFGVTNPNIAKAVKTLNLQAVGWSIRTLDTKAKSVVSVLDKITPKIKKGDIILLHDTSELSFLILEQLLQFLEEHKYKSVTIHELFNQ